jgi:predicted DNA-binding transcriptional regulator AlpA
MRAAATTAEKIAPPPAPPAELPDSALLKVDQVLLYVPISRAEWFRGVRNGDFPQPRRHGRLVFWHSRDIKRLIDHGFAAGARPRARPSRAKPS